MTMYRDISDKLLIQSFIFYYDYEITSDHLGDYNYFISPGLFNAIKNEVINRKSIDATLVAVDIPNTNYVSYHYRPPH